MPTLLVNRSVDDVLVKVRPSLHQAFSQVIDVMNLCFTHAIAVQHPESVNLGHMMTLVHFDEVIII